MAGTLTTFSKVRRAFMQLGVDLDLPDKLGLINFELDGYPFMLGVREFEESFYICDIVVGPTGNVAKRTFDYALEVTKMSYPKIEGKWHEDYSYITTTPYSLKNCVFIPKPTLISIIREFYNAHTFMEYNLFKILDESAWNDRYYDNPEDDPSQSQ